MDVEPPLGRARANQAKGALAAATELLKSIAGGVKDGKSWKDGVGNDDWAALRAKSQELFDSWDSDAAQKAADKVQRAKTAYLKEARELGTCAAVLKAQVKAAEEQLAKHEVTSIEVTLLGAVMESGTEGMSTCTQLMEEMISNGRSSEDIRPALWTEVTKLTKSAQTQRDQ